MRQLALALLLVTLTGCGSVQPYGNFMQHMAITNDKEIADDILHILVKLYPPASTQFNLQHVTLDAFGTYLVQSMRANGYAILEFTSQSPVARSMPAIPSGLALSYLIDHAKGSNLYRVALIINHQQSLARAYQTQGSMIYPAGYWVRKESPNREHGY